MASLLDGKVALVTGASSGIGEATALALARNGAKLAIAARRKDRLEALAAKIGGACVIQADVAVEEQARAMVRRAHEALGRIDILVNNAGVMLLGPIDGADTNEWRRMFDINVLGLMIATHAALPIMKARGSGHVVNISSVAGRFTSAVGAAYSATKFAVEAFSEGLRKQESKNGIRVTAIEPGAVVTELQLHTTHAATRQMIDDWIAGMKGPLQGEDIAAAIVYAVTQPAHVNVNQILIRPSEQEN